MLISIAFMLMLGMFFGMGMQEAASARPYGDDFYGDSSGTLCPESD